MLVAYIAKAPGVRISQPDMSSRRLRAAGAYLVVANRFLSEFRVNLSGASSD
jgi:hypothetical protein